ncbi:hypothetical protein ACIBG5_19505 [Kribbella sp. NPDC050241]
MKRRQFLTVGTAVMAAPALPSVTPTASAATDTLRRMVNSTKVDDRW